MRVVVWLIRAILFFTLFAFALNNQHAITVHWFFGLQWQAPLVIVVLLAFAVGAALRVLAMVPSWWRARRGGAPASVPPPDSQAPPFTGPLPAARDSDVEHPPRIGL